MTRFEQVCTALRHSRPLRSLHPFWTLVRPAYERTLRLVGGGKISRDFHGDGVIFLDPVWRSLPEDYERDVWTKLIAEAHHGDCVADVGSFIGLYAIALARRVGPAGEVHAFEPDPFNFHHLRRHAEWNSTGAPVLCHQKAVGDIGGVVPFAPGRRMESGVLPPGGLVAGSIGVECVSLDSCFPGKRFDLMKIDVEGFEWAVLRGASRLLADPALRPRCLFIEMHPHKWDPGSATGEKILEFLKENRYSVTDMQGSPVDDPNRYMIVRCQSIA